MKTKTLYLKLLSEAETLILDALDGKETLATANGTFPSAISSGKDWGTNKPGIATKEQAVDVYELIKNGTFTQMLFGSLWIDLDKLCLTQAQIKNFCKKHPEWLRQNGYHTFFLFKAEDRFFVAGVCVRSDGLSVYVNRFEYDLVWVVENSYRLVVPQLTA